MCALEAVDRVSDIWEVTVSRKSSSMERGSVGPVDVTVDSEAVD
jgi:hypothetical protein